ncbi:MAG: DHA2 family efflux MFS transporter permease subunit [Desulfobulbus sp.]|nr:DHA2 family efflux MFS transporter permease subunit [Desulfobulbus sp.]
MSKQLQQSDRLDPQVWKIVSVVALGPFLSQLDATVVNVSLSGLATELHARLPIIQWVTSGYLLALALMLPLNGWLVERIGAKKLYLVCFSGFTLCSALCALSWSAQSLIGFRVLQGACGGLMAPMMQLMMARTAGKHIVRVMSIAAIPILTGPILGPVVAGMILQYTSWRWLFLINLPIGILAITLALCFLPNGHDQRVYRRKLDLIGLLLLSPGLVLFLYGSDHIKEQAGIAALLLSILMLAAFFHKARRDGDRALIDLRLFQSRIFSVAAFTQFIANGLSFAGQMLIPVYLIRAVGQSPSATGWLLMPMGLGAMCTFLSLGRITQRFGIRGTSSGGASLALLGMLPFLYLSGHPAHLTILAGSLFLQGMGMSAVGLPSISAAYASVRKEELPMATTSLNIVQRLGGPTLTTLCATVLDWRLAVAQHSNSGVASAFTISFTLLICLNALLILATLRFPHSIEDQ